MIQYIIEKKTCNELQLIVWKKQQQKQAYPL